MTESTDFDAPTKPAWIGALVPVALVLGAAGLFWWTNNAGNSSDDENPPSPALASSGPLVPGQTYYLFASEIELYERDPEEEAWDAGEGGPDIRYRMLWKGNIVFNSNKKENSLIADWSGMKLEFNLKDLLGKEISPDKTIDAARVRAEKGGSVIIEVEDVDLTDDDEAGNVTISFDDLVVGKKEFSFERTANNAVMRVVMRALPVNSSATDLYNLMK